MTTTKKLPITPKNMCKLAEEIIDYLTKEDLFSNVCIYVNNQAWQSEKPSTNNVKMGHTKKGNKFYIEDNIDVTAQIEYNNPKTITMTFEGTLYYLINEHNYDQKLTELFLNKYDLYFEQGFAWSMAAYE